MAGYWTVADERFAARQTGDVSIIRAARGSATYAGAPSPETFRDRVQFNLRKQNKKRKEEDGRTEKKKKKAARQKAGAEEWPAALGQARPQRILGIFFLQPLKAVARCLDSTHSSDTFITGQCQHLKTVVFAEPVSSQVELTIFPVPDCKKPDSFQHSYTLHQDPVTEREPTGFY
ncbi:hypothetical protein EYF80_049771 [Liparis tanakae]|uniref:Uncharacterized protein n=1 Tax=Liparis tanakae TaxID=230148 RepID=A0A4Z2FFR0_9TELE|nr:hypothetical protein EYF80_049771 [Liparis tanakae]